MAHYLPGTQPVVTVQPGSATVVVSNSSGVDSWNSGICGCCNDLKSCCCAILCGNFYYSCLASRMGENCCVGCSGDDLGCVPGGHMAMRTKMRIRYNIQGSICDDCLVMHFCKPCAMCQLAREMQHRGYN